MKTAFLDCFAGLSGDMTLGALIDLGVAPAAIRDAVRSCGVDGFTFEVSDEARASIGGKRVVVTTTEKQPHRHLHHLEAIVDKGDLPPRVRARARAVFRRLTEAEARVHRQPVERVHLHEVGAVDAIVDVVGACLGFELLGIERCVCGPVVLGRGLTRGQHGAIPVPGPATLELLNGKPIRQGPVEAEMTTPTGAALAVVLADSFGPMPDLRIDAIGYGCGTRSFEEIPNLLRIVVGEGLGDGDGDGDGARADLAVVIEANVDDMSPELISYTMQTLLEAGALDVWATPTVMKKGRPGHLLGAIVKPSERERMSALLLAESTTIGVRTHDVRRSILERRLDEVATAYGTVRIKVARSGERVLNAAPEFEDCARLARAAKVPLKEVQAAAVFAWRGRSEG